MRGFPRYKPNAKQPPKVAPGAEEATVPAPVTVAPDAAGARTGNVADPPLAELGDDLSLTHGERVYSTERAERCPDCGAGSVVPQHSPGCTQAVADDPGLASGEPEPETRS